MTSNAARVLSPSEPSVAAPAARFTAAPGSAVGTMHERIVQAFEVAPSPAGELALRSFYHHAAATGQGNGLRLAIIAVAASAAWGLVFGAAALIF